MNLVAVAVAVSTSVAFVVVNMAVSTYNARRGESDQEQYERILRLPRYLWGLNAVKGGILALPEHWSIEFLGCFLALEYALVYTLGRAIPRQSASTPDPARRNAAIAFAVYGFQHLVGWTIVRCLGLLLGSNSFP